MRINKQNSISPTDAEALEKRVDEAARMYEKQFLGEMMKAMRSATSVGEAQKPSMAEGLYREELDDQYVDAWGESGGLGFHKVIHDQIMQMLGASPEAEPKPSGPIPLTDRDVLRAVPLGKRALRVDVASAAAGAPASKVAAPANGEVVASSREGAMASIELAHRGGARSTISFEGAPAAKLAPGAKVSAGDPLGTLSPDARAISIRVDSKR